MLVIRPVHLPDDRVGLHAIDRSFTTDRVYRLVRTPLSFALEAVSVHPPLQKDFPFEGDPGEGREGEHGLVAQDGDTIAGFATYTHERWNRRTTLWHLYVAPSHRRRGNGRALVEAVIGHARSEGMRCVWLESNTLAYPAIQFYRRLGFELCGLDTSLYDPTVIPPEETAIFFARSVSVSDASHSQSSV